MPAIPSATETVRDFGMGLSEPNSMRPVVYGVSSAGPQNALGFFNDATSFRDTHGEGPLVEEGCEILAQGGGPIIAIRADPSIAASNGAVTKTGAGPDITISGDATLDAFVRADITLGGALGVGSFRYCCDGYSGDTAAERTYSETLTIPAGGTFAIPGLGITLTFAAGTYVAGDFYTASVECAAANASDMADAFTALAASNAPWRFFHFVTSKANGASSAHATLAAALNSSLATLVNTSRYKRGIIPADAGEDTAAQAVTAFASTTAIRLMIPFGMVRRTSIKPFPGFAFPVAHSAGVFAARAASGLPVTDLKRVKSGSLEEVIKLFHDEFQTPSALDDNKISTLRTYPNLTGFYITQGRLKSPSGSDFKLFPHGLLMDIACEVANREGTLLIGSDLRVSETPIDGITGAIDPRDVAIIESEVQNALNAALVTPQNADGKPGYVTRVLFRIVPTNFLQTGIVVAEVGILPRGYVDYVMTTLGYVAALPAAAAA